MAIRNTGRGKRKPLFERNPHTRKRTDRFEGLSPGEKAEAYRLLGKWLRRRPRVRWRYPLQVNRARQLAKMTWEERRALGLRLQAIHGGLAVQQMYREQGRDQLAQARRIGVLKRKNRREAAEGAARRERLGLLPPRRWKRLPI